MTTTTTTSSNSTAEKNLASAPVVFTPYTSALRALAIDAVERAKSGHPGAPMGMAEIAEVLWTRHLKHNPADPHWPDRDRFVLSNGHGSMLIYGLLHLSGYDLSIEDLKQFRQLHSRTPGHPEVGITPGVETTTGPLGQGLANAVGMALAEKMMAARFNRDGFTVVDHMTWAFVGDGCLMEGISHEVASLAGVLGLGKLVVFYDDNGISIDGHVDKWFRDNTPARFRAYGWQVIDTINGHDPSAVNAAINAARADTAHPTLICCRTVIGQGSPNKAGTHDVHGAPLGAAEAAATKAKLGWNHAPFEVPAAVYAHWDGRPKGGAAQAQWAAMKQRYAQAHPALATRFDAEMKGELPAQWNAMAARIVADTASRAETIATRKASQNALEALGPLLPHLFGGSADLTGSNLTAWKGSVSVVDDAAGNYLSYGVREFGMVAIANGVALHGGLIPYTGTFAMFSDYARSAIRMAALMKLRQVLVLTHDSIGLGEDGPTHQPVEHASSLRLIPNLDVWRPCDAVETAVSWTASLSRTDGPSALLLSRQNVPHQVRNDAAIAGIVRGGYVLREAEGGAAQLVLLATGSEVGIAVAAQTMLAAKGVRARVVSMPCTRRFDLQPADWRRAVLPPGMPAVAIEAGISDPWRKYVGLDGDVLGIDTFGESAKAEQLFVHFGLTAERLTERALALLV